MHPDVKKLRDAALAVLEINDGLIATPSYKQRRWQDLRAAINATHNLVEGPASTQMEDTSK